MSNKCTSPSLLVYRNGTWIVGPKPQTAAPIRRPGILKQALKTAAPQTENRRLPRKKAIPSKKEKSQTKTDAHTAWTWADWGLTWPNIKAIGLASLIGVSLACNVVQYLTIMKLLER